MLVSGQRQAILSPGNACGQLHLRATAAMVATPGQVLFRAIFARGDCGTLAPPRGGGACSGAHFVPPADDRLPRRRL